MTTRELIRLILAALLPLVCGSCVVLDWPSLPPVTYRGRVLDEANRPVAGAQVQFHRPGQWVSAGIGGPYDDTEQEIAKTYTGKDGTFEVTTSGGYATEVFAESPHHSGRIGDVLYQPRSPELPRYLEIKLSKY